MASRGDDGAGDVDVRLSCHVEGHAWSREADAHMQAQARTVTVQVHL